MRSEEMASKLWSEFLWQQLENKDMTQSAMAKKLCTSQSRLNEWLNGKRMPNLATVIFVCKKLNVAFRIRKEDISFVSIGNRRRKRV